MVEGHHAIRASQLLQHIFDLWVILRLDFLIVYQFLLFAGVINELETIPVKHERLFVSSCILDRDVLALELEAVVTTAWYYIDNSIGSIAVEEVELCFDLVGSVAHFV